MSGGRRCRWGWALLWLLASGAPSPGCANTEESRKILAFFFDGVEEEEQAKAAAMRTKAAKVEPTKGSHVAAAPAPSGSSHAPYASGECQLCHPGGRGRGLAVRGDDLCLDCHSVAEFTGLYTHPPVLEGKCARCHSPHASKLAHLVRYAQARLCAECHPLDAPRFKRWHGRLGESPRCGLCHDAHSADNQAFLFTLDAKRCGACHPTQADPKTATHAPINAGSCADCHRSDHRGAPPFLVEPVKSLCFKCHDPEALTGGENHQADTLWRCTDCHEPHGLAPAGAHTLRRVGPSERAPAPKGGGSR